MLGFSCSFIIIAITITHYAYPNSLNKKSASFKCKYQIILITFFIFVHVSEDSIMANDDVIPSNFPVVLIKKKSLKKHHST
jgi:hypothetical protein